MSRLLSLLCLSLLLSSITACTTVSVTKVNPDPKQDTASGQRYSLPRPIIVATPKADGGLDVRVVMIPDPERTYAISASSYLATHSLVTKVENGLLTKVDWTADTAAVAAGAVKAAGESAKAVLDAEVADRKADKEAAKTAAAEAKAEAKAEAEAFAAQVKVIEDQIAVAEIEKAAADAEHKASTGDPEKAAAIKLAVAEAKLAELERQRKELHENQSLVAGQVAPGGSPIPAPAKFKEIPGPVMFEIVNTRESDGTVSFKLKEFAPQIEFEVFASPKAADDPPAKDGGSGDAVKTEPSEFTIASRPAEQAIGVDKDFDLLKAPVLVTDSFGQPLNDDQLPTATRTNSKSIKLAIGANHPAGKFDLEIVLWAAGGETIIGRAKAKYTVQ